MTDVPEELPHTGPVSVAIHLAEALECFKLASRDPDLHVDALVILKRPRSEVAVGYRHALDSLGILYDVDQSRDGNLRFYLERGERVPERLDEALEEVDQS